MKLPKFLAFIRFLRLLILYEGIDVYFIALLDRFFFYISTYLSSKARPTDFDLLISNILGNTTFPSMSLPPSSINCSSSTSSMTKSSS